MELTPAEIKVGYKSLQRLEKRAHQWKWARWVNVFISVLSLAVAAFAVYTLRMRIPTFADMSRGMLNGETVSAIELRTYANGLTMLWSNIVCLVVIAFAYASIGFITLILSLANWNRHVLDALRCSVLRAELEKVSAQQKTGNT